MPHPREEYKIKNVNYIKTDLIVKTILLMKLKDSSMKYKGMDFLALVY